MPKRHRRRHSRRPRRSHRPRRRKQIHPIATSIILIILAFIVFRVSFTMEGEAIMWSFIISIILFIAGLLVLVGWWRNHISNFNVQANLKWKH